MTRIGGTKTQTISMSTSEHTYWQSRITKYQNFKSYWQDKCDKTAALYDKLLINAVRKLNCNNEIKPQ